MLGKFIKMCLWMTCICCTAYSHGFHKSHQDIENQNEENLNKCYLSHKNVEVSNTQILYVVKDMVMPIKQLFSDEYGIYTIVDNPEMTVGLWNCPETDCKALNSALDSTCRKCGWPNKKK